MEKEDKIEIVGQRIKKIVILSLLHFSLDEFLKRTELIVKTGQPFMLNWAEGIVFYFMPYIPDSDLIIEKTLQGTQIWSALVFAPMPKYKAIFKFGAREVPIMNQTSVPHMKKTAQWLKDKIMQS